MYQMSKAYRALSLVLLVLLFSCTQVFSQNELATEDISNSIIQLTLKLIKLFYEPSSNGNILYSPINIYSALALIHLAANNESRSQITKLLGFPNDENQYQKAHETLSQVIRTVENTKKVYAFSETNGFREEPLTNINIANGIFVQKGVNLKPSYISQVQSFYKGEVSNLDFANDGSKATDTINQYISKITKGRIDKVFSEPLKPDTRVILASVLYFKATWEETFSEFATKDATFHTGSGTVNIKMMSKRHYIPYINLPSLKAQAIKLNYAGNDVSMIIVLPNADQQLENLIELITSDIFKEIVQKSKSTYVDYKVPKTKFNWSNKIEKHLQILGVDQIFTNNADLSNMLTDTKLKVSEITHVTEIEVNEKGTEASAATISQLSKASAVRYPEPIQFVVDRPFIFYILHRSTNAILFLGSVKNPNGN